MNARRFLGAGVLIFVFGWTTAVRAQQALMQQLSILDERLNRLRAEVEALQFSQQQLQREIGELRSELAELRRASGGASAAELQALEARIRAVDAARENDRKVILEQLARELAALGGARPAAGAAAGSEHLVQKGETLSTIARAYGVSVEQLRKANNLSDDLIRAGQKLVIPR